MLARLASHCPVRQRRAGPSNAASIDGYTTAFWGPQAFSHSAWHNAWTTRNTVFMTWNLLHLARMLKDGGGIPAYGNSTRHWNLEQSGHPNPECR